MARRSSNDEQTTPAEQATAEGISTYEAAEGPARDDPARRQHRDRIAVAAQRVIDAHTDALDRLAR
jgi:hypothetical protein